MSPRPVAAFVAILVVYGTASGAVSSPRDTACVRRGPQAEYGTKTAYELVYGGDADVVPQDTVDGCNAVFYWHLLRHGTRYPEVEDSAKMVTTLPGLQNRIRDNQAAGRVTLCEEDTESILSWSLIPEALANPAQLNEQGEDDLYDIGKRFRARYPKLIGDHTDIANQYKFRSTATQRTQDSARWYAQGIYEEGYELELPTPVPHDPLLEFYDLCPAWSNSVDNNKTALEEASKFKKSSHVRDALKRISERLGFTDSLTFAEAQQIWHACRWDQAWDPTLPAVWCAAFDSEDLLVFEYYSDLNYYYNNAYGNEINLQLGCPLVKDLVDKFSMWIAGSGAGLPAAGVAYFTHEIALEMTLARLGVGKDSALLTADNYPSMKTSRAWRVSKLVPFASNVAVVLYKCPSGDDQYKIKPYVNENPVAMDGCSTPESLCSWTTFQAQFSSVASECSLDFCSTSPGPEASTAAPTAAPTTTPSSAARGLRGELGVLVAAAVLAVVASR